MNSEEQDDLGEALSELERIVIKHKKKFIAAAVSLAVLVGGTIGYSHSSFQDFVKNNPPKGSIIYSIQNNICLIDVAKPSNIKKIQVPTRVEDLLWLNNQEVIYVSNGENENLSDHVYKLNIKTGKISTLFNPYSKEASHFFGDVKEKDALDEKKYIEAKRKFDDRCNKRKSGLKVCSFYWERGGFHIGDLGVGEDSKVYFKHAAKWYCVNQGKLTRPTLLPDKIITTQTKSPSENYELNKAGIPILAETYEVIQSGKAQNMLFELESGAKIPAWR